MLNAMMTGTNKRPKNHAQLEQIGLYTHGIWKPRRYSPRTLISLAVPTRPTGQPTTIHQKKKVSSSSPIAIQLLILANVPFLELLPVRLGPIGRLGWMIVYPPVLIILCQFAKPKITEQILNEVARIPKVAIHQVCKPGRASGVGLYQ